MTPAELREFEERKAWLPAEYAAQWTLEVREAWHAMRKAYRVWQLSGTAPDIFCGSIKQEGELTPKFIVNDVYVKYLELRDAYWAIEPKYINERRARMSTGDYGEQDDWNKEEK